MKNNLKSTLAIVVLFAAIAIFILTGAAGWLVNTIAGRTAAAETLAVDPAAAAAEVGMEALGNVEYYKDGVDAWLENLCAVSTADGCEMFTQMSADKVAENLKKYKAGQTCTATALKAVSVEENSQIWIVEYSATGWEEVTSELVAVAVERGEDGVWKFDMILPVPQDALVELLTPTPAPQK
ncbi:MAG TPA: hypothetical protein PKW33_00670 [Anaerolineaceae bacterium]|nr:hypothetical protein [Anaerolineaceae bacterium]HPN50070.1 hypothetical protein [Anaerolineaceae bacterium]